MEMVAASKMKKTQDTMLEGRPYSLKIKDVIAHVALANSEYPHPFYEERTPKKACFVVVSSDKVCVAVLTLIFLSRLYQSLQN